AYPSEGTTKWVALFAGRRRLLYVRSIMVDDREAWAEIIEAGTKCRTAQHTNGNHVEPDEERDGRGQRGVDGRTRDGLAEHESQQQAASNPHGHGDGGAGQVGPPAR